jgi:DNA polymerase-3 subunit gamma/tau
MELALVDCFLSSMPVARNEASATSSQSPGKVSAIASPPPRVTAPPVQTKEKEAPSQPAKVSEPPAQVKEQTAAAAPSPKVILPATAPPPPQAKGQTATGSPSLASEIERLKLNWKQIVEEVDPSLKKTKAIAWLKSGSKPVSMEKDLVTLSFGHKVFKENIEKQENARIVEKMISDYLGHTCKIECICETENNHMVKSAQKHGGQIISVEEK